MPSFLLELFSEEIPARMQKRAIDDLCDAFSKEFKENHLNFTITKRFVTPRRLAIIVDDLPQEQSDQVLESKGPKVSAPEAALNGFLKSHNITADSLEKRIVGKDEVYFFTRHAKGMPTAHLLISIVEGILEEFPWPKSMRWGNGETRWVRPLHSILCLFDGNVIHVEFAGVKSNNVTYGHRFLAKDEIKIKDPAQYESMLETAKVYADRDRRMSDIRQQANDAAAKAGLTVRQDQGLLEEVTGLVEWPKVLVGRIDSKYMDLPPEVLISEMRAHQKYFALQQKNGSMADQFLITSNMRSDDGGKAIIAGNERVLRARLADGRFFWDQDRKKPLSEWAEGLRGVTFHAKLGTIADKVSRVQALAVKLAAFAKADAAQVERACALCKADLVTGMVGEFPELQGIMGRYYALQQNEPPAVADAIRDHYLPLGPDSPVPTGPVSACVALADKLDTLISMFAVGEKPTGSKDPFALRRSALGIIRIILENNIRLPLKSILNEELIAFFSDRLKVMLKDSGIRHDVISAVMAGGDDDLVRVVQRAKALQAFLATDNGTNLLAGYRRAVNILTAEEKKSGVVFEKVDLPLFVSEEEKQLTASLSGCLKKMQEALNAERFEEAMAALAPLRAPLDAFFDKVMVNVEDAKIRANRLGLLYLIRRGMHEVADFSQLEG